MLGTGIDVFLAFPEDAGQRVLHPGRVVEVSQDGYAAEFQESDLPTEAGQEVLVYYEIRNRFSKQPARIDALLQTTPQPVIGFATTGEPVPADDRECYRVSTLVAELTVTLAGEANCALGDVSATGLSIISEGQYNIGQSLPIELDFEGEKYTGTGVVQNIKTLRQYRSRYGLSCAGDKVDGGNLERGVHKVGLAVQREQLRRRSGQTGT